MTHCTPILHFVSQTWTYVAFPNYRTRVCESTRERSATCDTPKRSHSVTTPAEDAQPLLTHHSLVAIPIDTTLTLHLTPRQIYCWAWRLVIKSESPWSVTAITEQRKNLPHAVPRSLLAVARTRSTTSKRKQRSKQTSAHTVRRASGNQHDCGLTTYSLCSGARWSWRAWRSTQPRSCAGAGSYRRS